MTKNFLPFWGFIIFFIFLFSVSVSAADADCTGSVISADGFQSPQLLYDGNERSYTVAEVSGNVEISNDNGIHFLYIVFDRIPDEWILSDQAEGGEQVKCGDNSFLHEYVDVMSRMGYAPKKLCLSFPAGTSIDEIYAFGEGDVPDWVQRWSPPCERADLLLLSSHSDDEQLFFAGVLPIYAGERGLNVQVVYLVNHFLNEEEYARLRPHEQLDGLWTVGVRNYPVMSDFPDPYSESLEDAIDAYKAYGFEYDDFTEYITECLRKFKPLTVVTHDVNGEYGHGTHILCTAAFKEALTFAADPSKFPKSAEVYGTWETEKAYLHLYPENPVILNLDEPLSSFGGKTAFEVTQDGFAKHKSQHWTWFYGWIYGKDGKIITKATDIADYSPCYYGLYFTAVGYDTVGNDFMENVKAYAERDAEEKEKHETDIDSNHPTESDIVPTEFEDEPKDKSSVGLFASVAVLAVVAVVILLFAVSSKRRRIRQKRRYKRRY